MKKLKAILITFLAIGTVLNYSCSKESNYEPNESKEKLIIGTWEFIKSEDKGIRRRIENNQIITDSVNSTFTISPDEYQHITFKKDNTWSTDYFMEGTNVKIEGTYNLKNSIITTQETSEEKKEPRIAHILQLNETTLIIQDDYEESFIPNVITYKVTTTTTCRRIK